MSVDVHPLVGIALLLRNFYFTFSFYMVSVYNA
jgi:hypothetical protein